MFLSRKKIAITGATLVATVATVLGTTSLAFGSLPPGTKVTGHSSSTVFTGSINGVPIKVTCTNFTDSVTLTSSDKTSMVIPPPTINGCTDSLGGTDTIATNKTHGNWMLKTASPGTTVTLVIPIKGATFKSSVVSSCVITAAPTKAVSVAGSYSSSTGTDTVTKKPIAVTGSGCTASNASTTTTVKFTPNPGKIPPFAS